MHAHASLNRAYRLVWNAALGAVVAAPETARGGGAPTLAAAGACFPLRRLALAIALGLGAAPGWALDAGALPQGGSLAAGAATWNTSGSTLTVNQESSRAIVNWGSFDIGSGATVRFVQPSASSVILNRVTGGAASQVDGALAANGQVYLVNPAGILFSRSAQVDVGGLTASTLGIVDDDFLAGRDRFTRAGSTGSVVNEGRITVQPGGRVALIGATVNNKGQIFAPGGDVALAAGQQVNLAIGANGHLQVAVDAADVATMVGNGGLVQADGGQIVLNARGANALAAAVVSNTGTLQARTVATRQGRILLLADMEHGTAQVGGTLDASAPVGGDGGGFVETSAAHVVIAPDARVDTRAASGATGTWLIDPQDITIVAGTPASADEVSAATLQSSLQTSNVTIATSSSGSGAGDIRVNADVAWSGNTLTLSAHHDILIDAVMTASGTAGLALNYGGNAGVSGATPAAGSNITTGQRGRVDFTGSGNTLAINGDAYTIIKALGADGSTTGADLQGINGNLSGRYALGADIDASATSGWASGSGFLQIGTTTTSFTGTFDGLGHVVKGLAINRLADTGVGLFGAIGSSGSVRNVTMANANIGGSSAVGILAGNNAGSVRNAGAQGTLYSNTFTGGLVGSNTGSIDLSWANTSMQTQGSYTGGLVGASSATGVISRSWANTAMDVRGSFAGGLVGLLGGQVTDSYATGAITGSGFADTVGGLVGRTVTSAVIERSYTDVQLPLLLHVGGVVGSGGGTMADVFWDSTRTGALTGNGSGTAAGTALTTSQLEAGLPSNFAPGTWGNAGNRSTPYLQANAGPVRLATDASGAQYQIVLDAAQLQVIATSARSGGLSGNYALGNDVDASVTRGWNAGVGFLPLGGSLTPYRGTFDGLGYTVTGLFMDGSFGGLFAAGQGASVRDLALTGATIGGTGASGVLASSWSAGSIERVRVSGTVRTQTLAGGLVGGLGAGGLIEDSSADVAITALATGATRAGGLVGINTGTIRRSSASGTVDGPGNSVGGLVGQNNGGSIEDSWATGAVTSSSTGSAHGGLVGVNNGSILRSYATGTVTGFGSTYGGLVGNNQSNGTIVQSWASGDVVQGGVASSAGGLVGGNSGSITDSFALGNAQTGSGSFDAGGLVGSNGGTVTRSYAAGVATSDVAGGLAGSNSGTITDSAWNSSANALGVGNNTGTLGNSSGFAVADLRKVSTFASLGWDIDASAGTGTTWRIYEGSMTPWLRTFLAPVTVTVSGNVGSTVYDGSNATGAVAAANTSISDPAAVLSGSLAYATSGKNVGTYATADGTLQMQGLYSGPAGYDIAYAGASTATITPKALAVTGAVAQDKVYDGTTAATVNGAALSGVVAGDTVTLSLGSATFNDKNVGSKTVAVAGSTLVGADAGNYTVADPTGLTALITPATISSVGGITAANRAYDGTTAATIDTSGATFAGRIGSDDLSVAGGTGVFDNRNAGTGKTVNITGLGLGGADAGNYVLANATATATATITPRDVTGTVTAADKVYDGGTGATTSGVLSGTIGGDSVGLASTGTFTSRNAGVHTVLISGTGLAGADAGNYNLVGTNATTTAAITPKAITGAITAADKVYDGTTTAATGGTLSGLVAGDSVSVTSSGSFADRNAGSGKAVTITGAGLAGTDAANYTLASYNPTATASITPKAITGTITAVDKVYDGTASATTTGALSGVIAGDVVTLAGTGTFDTRNAGTGKTVTISGVAVGGADAGNYTVTSNGTTTASITPKSITGTVSASDKVYDGTTDATTAGALSGVLAGDTVTLAGTGTFDTRNAGTGKTVTITGATLGGADAGNYTVTTNATTTASITPKAITGAVTASDKLYDGSTTATTGGSLAGVLAGDAVTLASTGTFDTKDAGTGKTVTITGVSLVGADAGNYTVTANGTTTAAITPKAITGTIRAADKVYDGTTSATTTGALSGVIAGDAVTLTGTGTFDTKDAGTGKTVTISGVAVGGADAANYTVTSNGTTTASITPKAITGTVTAADKVYDGTTTAALGGSLSGVLAGDSVTLGGTGTFADRNVGTGKTVTITGATLAGADAGNYTVTSNGTTTASITPKAIIGTITAADKTYDGTTAATTQGNLSGVLAGDDVALASTGRFADANAGSGKRVDVVASLAGTDAGNYVLAANATTSANIARAPLRVTANDDAKIADGAGYAGGNGVRYSGFVAGEGPSLLGGSLLWGGNAQGATQPGRYGIGVSGLLAANYDISYGDGMLAILPPGNVPAPGDVERRAWLALTDAARAGAAPEMPGTRARLPLRIAPDFLRMPD